MRASSRTLRQLGSLRAQLLPAIRRLARAPGFLLTVALLVAAVIALNATVFAAVHAMRWKSLPFAQADELVALRADLKGFGYVLGLSPYLYERVRDELPAVAVGGYGESERRLFDDGNEVTAVPVTAD